jgi:hypothetical protein
MVKEALIAALQRAGYDTMTACEHAARMVRELQARPSGRYRIIAGNDIVTVNRR